MFDFAGAGGCVLYQAKAYEGCVVEENRALN